MEAKLIPQQYTLGHIYGMVLPLSAFLFVYAYKHFYFMAYRNKKHKLIHLIKI